MINRMAGILVLLAALTAVGVSACQPKGSDESSMDKSSMPSSEQKPMTSPDTMKQESPSSSSGSSYGNQQDNTSR